MGTANSRAPPRTSVRQGTPSRSRERRSQEASGNSRDSVDDAEHNFESIGARSAQRRTELLSTPSARAVLNRDDAADRGPEPPLTEIHMPESRGPVNVVLGGRRFIRDPLVEIAKATRALIGRVGSSSPASGELLRIAGPPSHHRP